MRKIFLCSFLFVFAFVANSFAIPIFGTGNLGSFEGSFDFSASDDTTAQLIVTLKNTSPVANGGFLVAFNNPGESITSATLGSTETNFGLIGDSAFDNTIPASPFGAFDVGGASGSSWLGGGSPTDGIGVGLTETFTFVLTGSGFDSLATESFILELSEGSNQAYWFASRLRGFDDGGSDKVPGTPGTPIPESTTIILVGVGLIGLAGFGRKKFIK